MPTRDTLQALAALIGKDTTSRNSNLPLIEWAEAWLTKHGARCERVYDATGTKANLWATFGPQGTAGWVLSGHTDTVPVDGQTWTSDPFILDHRHGRYFGRGASDMKGFLACCLGLAPEMAEARLARPIHLALSYDEEIGCVGVRGLLAEVSRREPRPLGCIVGEPTQMQVCVGHKAKRSLRATFTGSPGHSSRAPDFVNAVEYGARLVVRIQEIAQRLGAQGMRDPLYDIPHSTAHVGTAHGGTALNMVPETFVTDFEFRVLPNEDADALVEEVRAYMRDVLVPEMQATNPSTGAVLDICGGYPGLDTGEDAIVATTAKRLANRNDHIKVAFGTEAGVFHELGGIPTVVCGPGSIAQAHQPDEYIEATQLDECEQFLRRLVAESSSP
jgi:acetylornithine deacetylase